VTVLVALALSLTTYPKLVFFNGGKLVSGSWYMIAAGARFVR
jgi:hypothetical protein